MQQIYHIRRQIRQLEKYTIPQYILDSEEACQKIIMVSRAERSRKEEGITFAQSADLMGVSRASLYRWARYMRKEQWDRLISTSRKPHHARTTTLPKGAIARFIELRRAYPGLGGQKIAVMMRREGYTISLSQADRLVTRLLRSRIIVPARRRYSMQNTGKNPRIPQEPPLKATKPGDIVEVDTLHLGKAGYQITAIDVVSRVIVSDIFPACTAEAAKAVLIRAQHVFPFRIRCVQTDGGSEFKGVCHAWCNDNDIYHYTIPPRSPEINGCVERMQGVWRQEYWHCYTVPSYRIDDLRPLVREWEHFYNYERPHGALEYRTPMEELTRIGISL